MKTVELVFHYTQDEFVKAEREYLVASKTIHKYDGILMAVFFLLSIIYLFLSSFSVLSIAFCIVVILGSVIGIYIYFFFPVVKFKQTAKYQEEYTMFFSEEDIRWKTATVDSSLKWNLYSEVWESDDFYFLIQAPRVYALIPKRAFRNDEMIRDFEEFVSENLKKRKHIG